MSKLIREVHGRPLASAAVLLLLAISGGLCGYVLAPSRTVIIDHESRELGREVDIASTTKVDNIDIAGTTAAHGLVTLSSGITGLPINSCGAGTATTAISTTGTASCLTFFNTAGTSLTNTGSTVNLNFPTTACAAGTAITSHNAAGTPSCSTFFNAAGDHLSSSGSTVSLAQIATASFLGRTTAGTGNVETLTATQATALLDTVTTSVKGLVPTLSNVATQYFDGTGNYSTPTGTSFGNHSTGLDSVCTFDGIASPVCGATLSGSTYTMTRDIFPASGSIANAVTLKPANFRIFVQGVFTGSGTATIFADGGNASGGTAGTTIAAAFYGAGTAGEAGVTNASQVGNAAASGAIPNFPANSTNSTGNGGASGNNPGGVGQVPSKGGGGGSSASNTAGGGGTVTLITGTASNGGVGLFEYSRGQNRSAATLFTGGSGGGGGSSTGTTGGTGGGGGGGGAFIYFEAGECAGTIAFTAKGGNGGDGSTGGTGTAGGGGGGGGGNIGVICGINSGTMTETVTGGTHGAGAGGGGNGGNGADGTKFIIPGR